MYQIQISKTVTRDYQNGLYRVRIIPERIVPTIEVLKRRPGARLFKYKSVASYLFPIICYTGENQYGINLSADDALVKLGQLAIDTYETDCREAEQISQTSMRQSRQFESNIL